MIRNTLIAVLAGLALSLSAATSPQNNMNLVFGVPFKPVYVHDELTGIYGWTLWDHKRGAYIRDGKNHGPMLDGRDIFKLDCKDGVFSIHFKENGPEGYYRYKNQRFGLQPELWRFPAVHAPRCHAVCEVKITKGKAAILGKTVTASPDWQKLDFKTAPRQVTISINPEPGTFFAIRELSVTAEYDKIGGAISLPGGGKLTALVMPANASYTVKRSVYNWRGWLWKITGTALPIEESTEVGPQEGKLVFIPGKVPNGGYDLTVNGKGGTLVYSNDFSVNNAMYNYLRVLGYKEFDIHHVTPIPAWKAESVLPAVNMKNRPKFEYHTGGSSAMPRYNCGIGKEDHEVGTANWYAIGSPFPFGHCSPQLMPPAAQWKNHPENLMMFANGKRQTADAEKHHGMITPCLTEPKVRDYLLRSVMDVMRAFDYRAEFLYCLGDNPEYFCRCPLCMAKNEDKSGKSYASVFFDFIREAAERAKKEKLQQTIGYCAYLNYTAAPVNKKVPDNMTLQLCLTMLEKPCRAHIDCSYNNAGPWKKDILSWKKLMPRERIGFATYDAYNPFLLMDLLDFLHKHGSYTLNMYAGLPMVELYTAYRWNQGDDPEKIVGEYYEGVYGKEAGKYLVEVQKLIYEYDKKYQHKPGEYNTFQGQLYYMDSLDRKTFDKIYVLFDKAEKILRSNKKDVRPLLWEKYYFLEKDLQKHPRSGCYTKAELEGFAKRLAEFIRICTPLCKENRYPYSLPGRAMTVSSIPPRSFLQKYCGLIVPTTKKYWTDEPVIREFLKDPVKAISGTPEMTPGYWKFPSAILRGGENGGVLRRASSGKGRMVASLELKEDLKGTVLLLLAGWDDEKPGKTTFRVTVNGKEIFQGSNTFPETASLKDKEPGYMYMAIPEEMLKKGENLISFENTVKDDPKKAVRQLRNPLKPEDGFTMKQDYYWGWLALHEVRIAALDHEFYRFSHGEKGSAWGVYTPDKPHAEVKTGKGEVFFKTMGSRRNSGIWVDRDSNKWFLPPGVRLKLRVTYSATGDGFLYAGFFGYRCDRNGKLLRGIDYQTTRLKVEKGVKTVERLLTTQNHEYICPVFLHSGTGTATITEFSLTPVK